MVNAVSDLLGIHPYELLGLVKPFHLELFLANWAETVCKRRVIRDCQILKLGIICCSSGGAGVVGNCGGIAGLVFDFTGFDPVLKDG